MKRILSAILSLLLAGLLPSAGQVTTFEMRHFTSDPEADGVTDFHGETEWLDTDGRVAALNRYADFASRFWGDPGLDTPLFTDAEVARRVAGIKPQPLTSVRQTLRLEQWRACGYKEGKGAAVAERWKGWTAGGARIADGCLVLEGKTASVPVQPLDWRFRMKVSLRGIPSGLNVSLSMASGKTLTVEPGSVGAFELYGDLENNVLFLSSGGKTVKEYPLDEAVTAFSVGAPEGRASLESASLYRFSDQREENIRTPYRSEMVFDEDFEPVPSMEGWQTGSYDDSGWTLVKLPSPLGGEKSAGESYYLRTKVTVDDFQYASLELEALDPAGEVWVNGEPAAVLKGRTPWSIDVRDYLHPGENVIAVRVKPYFGERAMGHSPSDHHFGWHLGRTSLILTKTPDHISEALVHTASLSSSGAVQHHRLILRNETRETRKGSVEINYYPWFPSDGPRAATFSQEVSLRPMTDNVLEIDLPVPDPALWSPSDPRLYKVEVILKDEKGTPVDDCVTTTGIRLIEQKNGELFINHRPEMLDGSQIFGFRLPVENIPVTIRCATDEMVMRDLVMAKALGNLLRIHIHSENDVAEGINDPRYAEYADQLGLYIIWQTAGWIRQGDVWNVDIPNFPVYMKQVFNHPSITMWEASNHPNRFKSKDFSYTDDYFTSIISTIARTDSSRLISPTSFWQHARYASYDGTLDNEGGTHEANPWLMHRMMTRGSQDSYSGYEHKWSELRKIPYPWAKACLEARDLCYFNFEHEESIGQPNWELARKEPWYKVFSYEKNYEKASIGRLLTTEEWRAGQAYQAFSAWESMKMQILAGVCGFSWCSLESGPNMFTYQKPLVDPFYVPKLAFHANKMIFSRIWAGSDDVDTAYGPGDSIRPVIFNLDGARTVDLTVELQNEKGRVLERKVFRNVDVPAGRSVTRLDPFRFRSKTEGCRFVVYRLSPPARP